MGQVRFKIFQPQQILIYLCCNCVWPSWKQFGDTSSFESLISQAKCCPQAGSTCSNNNSIVIMIYYWVISGDLQDMIVKTWSILLTFNLYLSHRYIIYHNNLTYICLIKCKFKLHRNHPKMDKSFEIFVYLSYQIYSGVVFNIWKCNKNVCAAVLTPNPRHWLLIVLNGYIKAEIMK